MIIGMLGIDIAKNTFQLHGADNSGKAVHKKRLARCELAAHVANLPACTIVMDACRGANYWARVFQGSGHSVKFISPLFVKPFVKTNKNDANSAWLGLVPPQSSSGDKQVLLGISKRGDRYSRTLLIHGARALLSHYKELDNDYTRWAGRKKATLSHNKAAVPLANKNARIIWWMLNTGQEFGIRVQATAA